MVEKITLTTVVGLVTTCSGEEFSDWAPSSPVLPSAPLSSFPSALNNDIHVHLVYINLDVTELPHNVQ